MMARDRCLSFVSVVQVEGPRLAPVEQDLRRRVQELVARGRRSILVDLGNVTDLDAVPAGVRACGEWP